MVGGEAQSMNADGAREPYRLVKVRPGHEWRTVLNNGARSAEYCAG
jgi:hypothetical protein